MTSPALHRVYTDGGCKGPGKPGGWAWVHRWPDGNVSRGCGSVALATNGLMELTAAYRAMHALHVGGGALVPGATVEVISDSEYIVKGINEWRHKWQPRNWRKSNGKQVEHAEIWSRLDDILRLTTVRALWVPGHTGNPDNEDCDRMATDAMETLITRQKEGKCIFDPREMSGYPIGTFHCPLCLEPVVAGVPHP